MARALRRTRPSKRLRIRGPGDLRNLLVDIPRLANRPEASLFEAALLRAHILPRSFLEKQIKFTSIHRSGHLNEAIAPLLLSGELERIVDPQYLWSDPQAGDYDENPPAAAEFFKTPAPLPPKPFRAGRYISAEHPDHYKPRGTRERIPMPLSIKNRSLLWYLGEGRLGEGLEMALFFIRRHISTFREDHPQFNDLPKDVL